MTKEIKCVMKFREMWGLNAIMKTLNYNKIKMN